MMRPFALWSLAIISLSASAQADDIMTKAGNHTGAKIVGYRGGRLSFRTLDGKQLSVWITDVELINVDRGGVYTDFNQAERFLAGERPEQALSRYRRTLRLGDEFWSDLFASRMLIAADRAGAIDTATTQFIRLLDGDGEGPTTSAQLIPRNFPVESAGKMARALEQVDAALVANPEPERLLLLSVFRFDLLQGVRDDRAGQAARRAVELPAPEAVRSEPVYDIILSALEKVLASEVSPATLAALDRAIGDCPSSALPDFLLLKGDVLARIASAREDLIRATYPLLRVGIHFPDDPRAARGYYGAGLILERMGRVTPAMGLLRVSLEKAKADPALRVQIEGAIARLQSANAVEP